MENKASKRVIMNFQHSQNFFKVGFRLILVVFLGFHNRNGFIWGFEPGKPPKYVHDFQYIVHYCTCPFLWNRLPLASHNTILSSNLFTSLALPKICLFSRRQLH